VPFTSPMFADHRPPVCVRKVRLRLCRELVARLLHIAPCVVRHGSRVALQFTSIMNKRHTNLWDRISKSARTPPVGQMKNWQGICGGWAGRLSGRTPAGLKARLPLPHQPPAQFSLSELSIRNGIMTFQTRDIRSTLGSWLLFRLVALGCRLPSSVCAGIDNHLSCSGRLPCNSLKSTKLGV
jgi:hypothetical protein